MRNATLIFGDRLALQVTMQPSNCPRCAAENGLVSKLIRYGCFYRTSDSSWVRRFRCRSCKLTVSAATFHHAYRQKKRLKNFPIAGLLVSGVSQRRAARLQKVNRKTVVRIFRLESALAEARFRAANRAAPEAEIVEFDDLETFEHTKCKPLSVTIAVEHKTRRILSIEVSRMGASGKLTKKARTLYGPRKDERRAARQKLLRDLKGLVHPYALIKSDQNPHYPAEVKKHFPHARHQRFKGKRGSHIGQGELKKVRFDPLFSLNHTCAMLRANLNRLFRKTWCTTKRLEGLRHHLYLYAAFHNSVLITANPAAI